MGTTYVKPAVRPAWGETNTTSADMVDPGDAAVKTGWPNIATPPSRQRFNWVLNFLANAVRYFMQRGLPDYDATETYGVNGVVIGDDGKTYKSLQAANVGHTPSSSPTWWTRWGFVASELTTTILGLINTYVMVAFSATPAFDCALGRSFEITLTGNVTSSTLPNKSQGMVLTFVVIQDATGGRTFTWPTVVKGGADPDPIPLATSCQRFIVGSDGNAHAVSPMEVS